MWKWFVFKTNKLNTTSWKSWNTVPSFLKITLSSLISFLAKHAQILLQMENQDTSIIWTLHLNRLIVDLISFWASLIGINIKIALTITSFFLVLVVGSVRRVNTSSNTFMICRPAIQPTRKHLFTTRIYFTFFCGRLSTCTITKTYVFRI